jgi:hypothetical protein
MKARNSFENHSSAKKKKEKNKPLVGRMKFFFKNPTVDGYFAGVLAYSTRGGADLGEDELAFANSKRFHDEAMVKIKHPNKKMIVGSAELGASGKNMMPNFNLIRETTFDWLDELFAVSDQKEVAVPEIEQFCS